MPTAPEYGQSKVALAPFPGARATAQTTPDTFGADTGATIQKAGAEIYRQETDKANEQALFEARRKLNDWELSAIYDPKTGAISKRGKDAFDIPETLNESFTKTVGEVSGTLSNDAQRFAFQRLAEARRESTQKWAQGHVAVERDKFYVNSYNADMESSSERAAVNPANAAGELMIQKQRTLTFAQDRGMGTEETQQLLQKVATNTHSKVVNSFIAAGAVNDASNWLTSNKADIDVDTYTQLQNRLKPAADQAKGLAIAEDIKGITTYDEAQAAAKKAAADNPVAYKVAMVEYEHERAQRDMEARKLNDKNQNVVDGFMAKVYAGGRAPSIPQLQQLPEFKAMDGGEQLKAIDKARSIARSLKAEANAGEGHTDPIAYGNALEAITAGGVSVADVASMPGLNRSTKMNLMQQVVAMQNGQDNDIPNLKQAQTIFTSTFLGANNNKKVGELNDAEHQRLAEMQTTYTQMLRDAKADLPKGAKLNAAQMQKVADDMFIKGKVEGTGFSLWGMTIGQQTRYRGDIPQGAKFIPETVSKPEDIPLSYRNRVGAFLASQGKTVTPKTILDEYNATVVSEIERRKKLNEERVPRAPSAPAGETPGGAATGMVVGTTAPNVSDLTAKPGTYDASTFGNRSDGTPKGTGYLGVLRGRSGDVMTEYTIGVKVGGKQMDVPTLVPTLTRKEVEEVLAGKVSDSVARKATNFAEQRVKQGKSVFAGPGDRKQ